MNDSPLVSVIMPAFNAGKFIPTAIRSVINQDYINWELIIIDDGSSDETATIVQRFIKEDTRVKYYYKKNEGQGIARNLGISYALGEYIAFLDSDDFWLPQKLSISIKELLSGQQDLIFTQSYAFSCDADLKDISNLSIFGVEQEKIYYGKDAISQFMLGNKIPMLTVVTKKEILISVNGFPNLHIAEDFYVWIKLLFEGYTFKGIPNPLSAYRNHSNSLMYEKDNDICEVLDMFVLLSSDYLAIKTHFQKEVQVWILSFINNLLSSKNYLDLKGYLKELNQFSLSTRILFAMYPLISFRTFRRLVRQSIIH